MYFPLIRLLLGSMMVLFFTVGSLSGSTVVIDGNFDDWENVHPLYVNPSTSGISFIKVTQDENWVSFNFFVSSERLVNAVIKFDLDHNSNLWDDHATLNAEASWMLGTTPLTGTDLTANGELVAAEGMLSNTTNGWQFELRFSRAATLLDGTSIFGNPGEEVWFTVGTADASDPMGSPLTTYTLDLIPVPEPSVFLLLGPILLGMFRRRRE